MDFGDEEGSVFLQFFYEHLKNFCTLCGSILHHHLLCDLNDPSDSDSDSDDDFEEPPPPPPDVLRTLSSFLRGKQPIHPPLVPSSQPALLSTLVNQACFHVGESSRQNLHLDSMQGNWDPSPLSERHLTRAPPVSDIPLSTHSTSSPGYLSDIVGFCSTKTLLRDFSSQQNTLPINPSPHHPHPSSTRASPILIPDSSVAASLHIIHPPAEASVHMDSQSKAPMDLNKPHDISSNLEIMSPTPITMVPPPIPQPIHPLTGIPFTADNSNSSKESSASVPSIVSPASKKRKFEDTSSPSSSSSPPVKRRVTLVQVDNPYHLTPSAAPSGEVDTPKPPPAK